MTWKKFSDEKPPMDTPLTVMTETNDILVAHYKEMFVANTPAFQGQKVVWWKKIELPTTSPPTKAKTTRKKKANHDLKLIK